MNTNRTFQILKNFKDLIIARTIFFSLVINIVPAFLLTTQRLMPWETHVKIT